jgi:hypothetical protein
LRNIAPLILVILSLSSVIAQADDCRNSTSENCYFTAQEYMQNTPQGPKKVNAGEFYFKSGDGYFSPNADVAITLDPGTGEIYAYNLKTGASSAVLATVTGPGGAYGEAYRIQTTAGLTTTEVRSHREPYTYCRNGPFGLAKVHAEKTVKELSLILNGKEIMPLIAEGNFKTVYSVPVLHCP